MKRILTILILIILSNSKPIYSQCLSGTYTIGGSSPSYTTINNAIAALTTNGVCGPVFFNIRSGTYTEQISIPQITGSSAINTITFQSETLDSTSVTIQYSGFSSNNYVIRLNGGDFIKLYKLKIKNTNSLYNCAIRLQSSSDNSSISNCHIEAPNSAITGANIKTLVMTNSLDNENIIVNNNYFYGGAKAIELSGNTNIPSLVKINNNKFQNHYDSGISLNSINSPKVEYNTFNFSTPLGEAAIRLYYCNDSASIRNNKLTLTSGNGIHIEFLTGNNIQKTVIANNIIKTTGAANGVFLNSTTNILLLHNTIVINGAYTDNFCITATATDTTNIIKNNILYQKGIGKIYTTSYNGNFISDYNSLFCLGSVFGAFNNVNYTSLSSWKDTLLLDLNSIYAAPQFVSTNDLHILSDFSQNLILPFFSEVPKDYDEIVRDYSSPYFGAYEYFNTLNSTDIGINKINNPKSNSCPGIQPVSVLLKNYGTDILTSATVNWSINNIQQTPFNWSGNLGFYDSTSINIGSINFSQLSSYLLKVWTTLPNGITDNINYNDTLSHTLYSKMIGNYTVGGTNPDYPTIMSALNDLQLRTVCGSVILNIRAGTYNEAVIINTTQGLNNYNNITLQAENGINTSVLLTNTTSPIIFINQSDNIILKDLSIGLTSTPLLAIQLGNSTDNIEINNCRISSQSSSAIFCNLPSGISKNIRILNNYFQTPSYNINLISPGGSRYQNVKIENNVFTDGQIVIQNTDTLMYNKNTSINTIAPSATFSYVNQGTIKNSTFSSNQSFALSLESLSNIIVANNLIRFSGTAANQNAFIQNTCGELKFLNNSILCLNTNPSTAAMNLNSSSLGTNNKYWNNIVVNQGPGLVLRSGLPLDISLKNNAYFGNGNYFGNNQSTSINTFNDWINFPGHDTNSIEINPIYNSNFDLRANEILINNSGVDVSNWISDDFDNQIRNNPPDIGAYEFTPFAIDAGLNNFNLQQILCTGNNPVQVYLKNNGSTILNSATINYEINSVVQSSYSWSGALLPGNETQITLGNYNFLPNISYSAKAYVSNPNGIADILPQNDTTKAYFSSTGLSGTYTIGGTSPNFVTINDAINSLKNGGICGPVIFNIRNGIYNEQVKIPSIVGTSSTNTITFQSENLDSTLVTIQYNSTLSTNNYTINIDTTDYIILNKLSLKSLNTSNSTVISLFNSANHTNIKSCLISSPPNGNSYLLDIQNADFCTIQSTKLLNSAGAISIAGGTNVSILKNYFEGQTSKGLYCNGLNQEYSENTFHYPSSSSVVAIEFSGSISSGKMNKNKILVNGGTQGIKLSSILDTVIISNNFIIGNGGTGIVIIGCSNTQLLNNSIFQQGPSQCIALYTSTNCKVFNNIFYNTSNLQHCITITNGSSNLQSNYNCIYNPYNLLVNYFGNNYNSLAAYNAVSGNEGNSVSIEPYFSSLTDLHVNTQQLDGTGTPNSNIIDDIDNELRNISLPDIGADEFTYSPVHNDVQLINIYVSNSNCAGTNTLYAKIKNMASDTLFTLNFSTIHQGITQPIYNWNGALAQGQTQDSIPVAAIPYNYGNNTMKIWTYDPNGNVDENHINDTLTLTQLNAALNGTYTIGGSSPDFATLRQAVSALRQYGICNNVVLNIRPGTYTDTLTIFPINGTASYNITFKSENNDSSSVILTDFPSYVNTANYIISLNATQNITFEKITFQKIVTTTTLNNSCIYLKAGTTNNTSILNCRFIGNSSNADAIYLNNSNNHNNLKVKNNLFSTISQGLVFSNSTNGSLEIENNTFENCSITGIYGLNYAGNCTISKNKFYSNLTNSATLGIRLSNVNSMKIDHNVFKMKTGCAMDLGYAQYLVENNFIKIDSVNNTSFYAAIVTASINSSSQFVFNTIDAKIFKPTNYCLSIQSGSPMIVKNNIIINSGATGKLVYGTGNHIQFDYNRYYSTSNSFGTLNTTDYNNLSNWQTSTGIDQNSQFKPTHLNGTIGYEISGDYDLNNSGTPILGVTTDIRDSLRNPLNPDIGAYEFNLNTLDAEIKKLKTNDSLLCAGITPVTVTIRNAGLTTINNLNIHWAVNNIAQPSIIYSGTLNSGDTTDVILGNYNFRGGNIYKLKFYSSLPNGIIDSSYFNDTLTIPAIKTRFSGTYTIGGTNPDFLTFKDAVDTLLLCGLCGPSIFNFRAGNYTSNFTVTNITGSSAINTVTFQSELLDSSQVSIIDNGPSLTLNGIQNINFKHLSFQQNSAINYSTIQIIGYSKNIEISNCSFNKPNGGISIGTIDGLFMDSISGDFRLKNSIFLLNTKVRLSRYTNHTAPQNFLITNNIFSNTNEVLLANVEEIEYSHNSNTGDVNIYANKNFSIHNNSIINGNLSITTDNQIHNKIIYNNIIDSGRLKITSASPISIIYNTIVSDNINYLNPANGCINFVGTIQNSKIQNNILSVRNGNNVYTINDSNFVAGSSNIVFDYNVVYTSGDTIAYSFNAPNEIKKTQWKNNYHQDIHSSFFQPIFSGSHDFHLINDYHSNNIGIPNPIINTDFDGITRSSLNPDPGVYEFNVIQTANDAGILNSNFDYCGSGLNPVNVTLKNYGNNILDSVEIHWKLNGLAQTPYQWIGALQPDSTIDVTIGSFTPSIINNNNLAFFTSIPNGLIDSNTTNDSLSINGHSSSLSGIYTIGGTGADFNSFFDATNTLSQVGICGPTEFIIADGNYFNTLYLSALQNITGNNEYNTITFRSQSGNPSSVKIDFYTNSITSGNLLIQNVTGLTFKDLTIIGTIELGANAKNIKFIGNKFNTTTLTFAGNYTVKSSDYNENIEFLDNHFVGTNRIFHYNHPNGSTNFPKKLILKGNIFENTMIPIEINNVDSLVIDSNMFYRTGVIIPNSIAIRVMSPKNHFEITRNIINGDFEKGIETGQRPIQSRLSESIVSNNVIINNNPSSYCGIFCWTDSLNINYNSINISGSTSNAIISSGSHQKIMNNILYSDSGKLISRSSSVWQIQSDYNVFYSTGSTIVSASSTNYSTLSSYSSATGMDTHSLFLDPQFVSDTSDLHYLNSVLNGIATPLLLVPYDQQHHLRNANNPNPGAYETAADTIYDSTSTYLVVKRLVNDTLIIGANTLTTVIKFDIPPHTDTNYYKYTGRIDSLRIHYKVNHHPEITETWQGTMRIGDSLIYTFNTPLNVPNGKRYDIRIWVENLTPQQTEIEFSDDSIHKEIYMPMLGNYTIGGIEPDFTTYHESYFSLYYCGTIGDVKFLYRPGIYSENIRYESFPNPVLGLLEYTSETGNSNDVNIRLQWFFASVFKFSNLTITLYTNNSAVYPDDGVEIGGINILFDSCKFIGGTVLNEQNGFFFKKPYDNVSASIKNCEFHNLKYAFNLSNIIAYGSNGSTNDFIFENNLIDSCEKGILLKDYNAGSGLYNGKNLIIRNNTINTLSTGIEISGNGVSKMILENNYINSNEKGINATAPVSISKFINNMVYSKDYNLLSPLRSKLYNNTFNKMLWVNDPVDSLELYNNIFSTDSNSVALIISHSNSFFMNSDNNNYYSPNSPFISRIGNIYSGSYTDYVSPQDMSSALFIDSNSVNFNPLFLSNTDLHSQSSNLKGLAKPFNFIDTDIDGESRLLNAPDIGADEINLIVTDVWPGDADKDNSVTNYDLLPIGLFYGYTGSPRASISNTWQQYPSMDWGIGQSSGYDIKHVDCNGDGIIDNNDTLAINLNFSSTHSFSPTNEELRLNNPPLYWITNASSYTGGDTVIAELHTGDFNTPIDSIYAIAFDIFYNESIVQNGSETLDYTNNWLGTVGINEIKISKIDAPSNIALGAISRINHVNASGFGKIATFKFTLDNSIYPGSTLPLNVVNYVALKNNGDTITLSNIPSNINLIPNAVGINEIANTKNVFIAPNPFNNNTSINYSIDRISDVKIEILSSIGQTIECKIEKNQSPGLYVYPFNLKTKGYDSGIYLVKITIDGVTTTERIIGTK